MKQNLLFKDDTIVPEEIVAPEIKPAWHDEWVGMPEFIQGKQAPYSTIIVRLETKEDLEEFAKLIGQKLTGKTKSIWHPFKPHCGNVIRRWSDES